ncbi:PKD domain-containing protein [Winogradskya consettensis]|uniref:PKD domain-containing protein n=1 Tax=Winogradskya consettensis TaxID=113560 RepID=UPI001BB39B60|nr:PKD domain-containing protein [Actinoplanes consettensis]
MSYRLEPERVTLGATVELAQLDKWGDDGSGAYMQAHVNWGDGTPVEDYGFVYEEHAKPHRYAKAGTYRVSATVENIDGIARATFPEGDTVTVVDAANPGGDDGGGGDGGGLPVTGPGIGVIAAGGGVLVLAGGFMAGLLRRRRVRFMG